MGATATREERLAILRQILKSEGKQILVVAELGPWKGHFAFLDGIRAAADSGADIVKVQVFRALHFPVEEWKAKERLEWQRDCLPEFVEVAHAFGTLACASVFDLGAVMSCDLAGMDSLKLASREWKNSSIHAACIGSDLPFFSSVPLPVVPMWAIYRARTGTKEILLACVPSYPTSQKEADHWLKWSRHCTTPNPWGWSSHTEDWIDCIEAVNYGARVIEKHLALTPDDPEIDWSLLPEQFAEMVTAIRRVEHAR